MNDHRPESDRTTGHIERYRDILQRFSAAMLARLDALRGRSAAVDVAVVVSERDRRSAGALLAGALAFRFFAVLVPFVVVWVAILGFSAGNGSTSHIVHSIGLTGYVAASVSQAARLSSGGKWIVIIVGLFALIWASLSALRSVRTAFAIAWGMPVRRWGRSIAGALIFILVLNAAFAMVVASNWLRGRSAGGGLTALLFLTIVFFGLWLCVSRLLPHAANDWRGLMPGAVLVAIGVQVLQVVTLFLIWRVTRTSAFYGPLGLAIVLLLWLYLMARVLIASALLNAQIWERRTGQSPPVAGDLRLDQTGTEVAWTAAAGTALTPAAGSACVPAAATAPTPPPVLAAATLPAGTVPAGPAPCPSTAGPSAHTIVAASAISRPDRMEVPVAESSDQQTVSSSAPDAEPGGVKGIPNSEAEEAAGAGALTLPSMPPPSVPAPPRPTAESGDPGRRPRHRLRAWIALSLVILAVVTALVTSIAFWAHGLLFNTDKFVSTVAPVMKEPQVQKRLATRVVDEAITLVDLQQRLDNVLPQRLKFLAGPVTDQIDSRLTKRMQQVLASQQFYNLWERILTRAHETMVAVLNGDSKVIQLQGNAVVLNTIPILARALNGLAKILPDVIATHIPTIDPDLPVDQQKAELEAAINRPIPDNYAQITLYQNDQIATAQKAVHLFNVLIWVLFAITLVLVAIALVVSPRRLRTLIQLGIGAVLVVALVNVAVDKLANMLISGSKTQDTGLASIFTRITDNLTGYILWLLIGGAILTVIAYLATKPRWVRKSYAKGKVLVSSGAQASGRVAGQARERRAPATAWISHHLDGFRVGGVVVGVLVLLLSRPGLGAGLAVIIVFAAYEFLITYLGRPMQSE